MTVLVVWQILGTGISHIVKASVEFFVVHVNTVVIDSHGNSLSGEPVGFPNVQDSRHFKHPLAALVQRILVEGSGGDAVVGGVAKFATQKIRIVFADRNFVVGYIIWRILAGSIPGAVITALGIDTAVAVRIVCPACVGNEKRKNGVSEGTLVLRCSTVPAIT